MSGVDQSFSDHPPALNIVAGDTCTWDAFAAHVAVKQETGDPMGSTNIHASKCMALR